MYNSKNHGVDKVNIIIKGQGNIPPSNLQSGTMVFGTKYNGSQVALFGGLATDFKSQGGKKRRKGEDHVRSTPMRDNMVSSNNNSTGGPSTLMEKNASLKDGIFTASPMNATSQPKMIPMKTMAGASHVKKLGSNLEGPYEPSGQNLISN